MANKQIRCYTYNVRKGKNICKKDFLFEIVDLILNKDDKDVNVLENSNKVRVFEDSDDTYSIELLKNINRKVIPNNYMFFRLGRKKEIEGALKRDKGTLVSEEVLDKDQQQKYNLEICTYILIDTTESIIMELFGQFAPAVNSFVKIVNRLLPIELKNKNVVIEYNKILTEKMIEALKKGGVKLSNIGYNYNIPNANVLRYLGLDTKQISALEELNVFEIQVNIKNKPRIPLTKNVQKIGYEIDAFKECNKDIKDTLFFRGKTAETDNKNYKFTNEEVTYAISVNTSRVDEGETIKFSLNEMAEQIYDKMKIVYDKNIEDIKKYIE
ncbi:hypothetical protein BJV85_001191 [Clostridium acetobutylicum]|uniref:Uncharacterized protein n=1 Tax=Clostridium acetobutylicum (strain ATCC 824 / DSM 792 / JCM 1419 / IAM 19013 / LMG 5710 / NBRC 13948 / NRRL B-527 / VKM B-1787 / 2291 / W) TaxID=272562 RepID=Q97FN1_CLOAB|nr:MULTISPECIES: hypothetical protein [Clostridium]AAK80644.1 Hypothetical protein CA_C2697 [Clostridium acetobutylicum ATCC 824]ADZ21743.1 Conserved hypothetical protein [Clostridium acetobutylicum EA 2018]AEI32506.1 hypothetical protein SMB_G2732 [Clostridium acetobutylicum DSM 1731]AWV78939.1 hypothetical protein DK921_02200 [Clostridium acetobutylicum]MBC2395178.1 hypothetical protein [Clostridium acetobutylicum]